MNHIITVATKIDYDYVYMNRYKKTCSVYFEEHYLFESYRDAAIFMKKSKKDKQIAYVNYSECH